jgi:hypothetical protein
MDDDFQAIQGKETDGWLETIETAPPVIARDFDALMGYVQRHLDARKGDPEGLSSFPVGEMQATIERLIKTSSDLWFSYGYLHLRCPDVYPELASFLRRENWGEHYPAKLDWPDRLVDQHLAILKRHQANLGRELGRSTNDPTPSNPERLVTLDQAAAIVNRSTRTLERYKKRGMPEPRVRGQGGKFHEYSWAEMRVWLEETFSRSIKDSAIEHYQRFQHPKSAGRH